MSYLGAPILPSVPGCASLGGEAQHHDRTCEAEQGQHPSDVFPVPKRGELPVATRNISQSGLSVVGHKSASPCGVGVGRQSK